MNPAAHQQTAPEDRIKFTHRLAYGAGAFVNNLLAAASGSMMIVLNLGLGMNPALVGWLGALPRLTDAFTDPVMGFISDNTHTRWGRRRPFIFTGVFVAAILGRLPALGAWWNQDDWGLLARAAGLAGLDPVTGFPARWLSQHAYWQATWPL